MRRKLILLLAATLVCICAPAQTRSQLDPQGTLWSNIKRALKGPNGEQYFESSLKDALIPRLKGTLISASGESGGTTLILGLTDSRTPEVMLKVAKQVGMTNGPEPGAHVEFEGVPTGFTKEPFLLTFEIFDKHAVGIEPAGAEAPSWYFGSPLDRSEAGHYVNQHVGVEFDWSADWIVQDTRPSSDAGEIALLTNSGFNSAYAGVWMKGNTTRLSEIPKRLLDDLAEIAMHRSHLRDYRIRPESVHQTFIGGRQPLVAVADYQNGSDKMSESLTWIVTEDTQVLFFARVAAYDLPLFQVRFDEMIHSAVVP